MVCYKCEKCNKQILHKSNYLAHINRKKNYVLQNYINYKLFLKNKFINLV
jgi:hypothetical protein